MTETAINYGIVLYELEIDEKAINHTAKIWEEIPEVAEILTNPTISMDVRHSIISKIFPEEIVNFLKKMCDNHKISMLKDVLEAYHDYRNKKRNILSASLYYVTEPKEEQRERIEKFLCRKYGAGEVELTMVHAPELLSGFIIRTGSREFDWSVRGRMQQLASNMKRGERVEFN